MVGNFVNCKVGSHQLQCLFLSWKCMIPLFFFSYLYFYFIIYFHSIFCFFLKFWCFTNPSLYQSFLRHLEHYSKIFRFLCPQLLWILIFSIIVIKQTKVVKYIYIDAESCMHKFSIAAAITRKGVMEF